MCQKMCGFFCNHSLYNAKTQYFFWTKILFDLGYTFAKPLSLIYWDIKMLQKK